MLVACVRVCCPKTRPPWPPGIRGASTSPPRNPGGGRPRHAGLLARGCRDPGRGHLLPKGPAGRPGPLGAGSHVGVAVFHHAMDSSMPTRGRHFWSSVPKSPPNLPLACGCLARARTQACAACHQELELCGAAPARPGARPPASLSPVAPGGSVSLASVPRRAPIARAPPRRAR